MRRRECVSTWGKSRLPIENSAQENDEKNFFVNITWGTHIQNNYSCIFNIFWIAERDLFALLLLFLYKWQKGY